ncbi:MAG: glycosyltransferase family 1 protein [Luteolibacter sp.]
MPTITHHQRLPYDGQVSIERLFGEIRSQLTAECRVSEATSPFPSKGLLSRLRNLLHARRQRADVHHIVGDVHYLAFGLPPPRTVLTIHDCAALNRLTGWKREILRYFWFTGPMRRAAVVTTISETTKNELLKWMGPLAEKVVVVPNCVGSEFTASPKPWPENEPLCLQVGTGWNKNVERVAEALRDTGCRLEIVGRLTDSQRMAINATGVPWRELGRISDEELVAAYHRCDFLMFASLYEGFGLPILEAQATGRPVITSNLSSMPEVAGEGALLVDPMNPLSISNAVKSVISDATLRSRLIRDGFENVTLYRPESVARRYEAIYRKCLANAPAL